MKGSVALYRTTKDPGRQEFAARVFIVRWAPSYSNEATTSTSEDDDGVVVAQRQIFHAIDLGAIACKENAFDNIDNKCPSNLSKYKYRAYIPIWRNVANA